MTDKPTIYEQHDVAFKHVSAYVVTDAKGAFIAKVAFKYPRDGAGRIYCYLHVIGTRMARGSATGYGYDKKTAAASSAAEHISYTAHTEHVGAGSTVDTFIKQAERCEAEAATLPEDNKQ